MCERSSQTVTDSPVYIERLNILVDSNCVLAYLVILSSRRQRQATGVAGDTGAIAPLRAARCSPGRPDTETAHAPDLGTEGPIVGVCHNVIR